MDRAGAVVARAELTAASYLTCARSLLRGQVKRCLRRGPLVGYVIACPSCGLPAPYLDEDVGYEERDGALVGISRPPACMKCGLLLRVSDGHLEAVTP